MQHGETTIEARVAARRYRTRLQAEMGSDWTQGREDAHREADGIAHRQMSMAKRSVRLAGKAK